MNESSFGFHEETLILIYFTVAISLCMVVSVVLFENMNGFPLLKINDMRKQSWRYLLFLCKKYILFCFY
jgi:hypothetical protein